MTIKKINVKTKILLSRNDFDINLDKDLSWKAKGIYCFLKEINKDKIECSCLLSTSKDGIDSVNKGLQELYKKGYIEIENTEKAEELKPVLRKNTSLSIIQQENFKSILQFAQDQLKITIEIADYFKMITYYEDIEIIKAALIKAKKYKGFSVRYILTILKSWKKSKITTFEELKKRECKDKYSIPQHRNFVQRDYDDEYFESVYDNPLK